MKNLLVIFRTGRNNKTIDKMIQRVRHLQFKDKFTDCWRTFFPCGLPKTVSRNWTKSLMRPSRGCVSARANPAVRGWHHDILLTTKIYAIFLA